MSARRWERVKLAGYKARTLGRRMSDCPYPEGVHRDAWETGWMQADAERRR